MSNAESSYEDEFKRKKDEAKINMILLNAG
jgi:hypothetical protein